MSPKETFDSIGPRFDAWYVNATPDDGHWGSRIKEGARIAYEAGFMEGYLAALDQVKANMDGRKQAGAVESLPSAT
jgi:hypothetical protein